MQAEMIDFEGRDGRQRAYLARPDGERLSALIVLQEWWGLNSHIQHIARRFAEAGYVALAPDLYHGRVVTEPDEARKLAMSLDGAQVVAEIAAAVDYLKTLPAVDPGRIGVVGFCLGGSLAQHAGARVADVRAVVAFYGGRTPDAAAFADRPVAILNLVGEEDRDVLAAVRAFDDGLSAFSLSHELVVYPGAGHAFFNDERPQAYDAAASADAWTRTLAWFEKHLG